MKVRKVLVISLAVVFMLTVLLSCVFIFSIKKIDAKFNVATGDGVAEIQNDLNKYVGDNLLFLDVEDVYDTLGKNPYYEIVKVEKNYPNVLTVEFTERLETYCLEYNGSIFVLDKEGFVLKSQPVSEFEGVGNDRIMLELDSFAIRSLSVGSRISTDDNETLFTVFEMAMSARLTDCINKIKVRSFSIDRTAWFYIDTGVTIQIPKVFERGVDKILRAFEVYDNADDYFKSFDTLYVTINQNTGEIQVDSTGEIGD